MANAALFALENVPPTPATVTLYPVAAENIKFAGTRKAMRRVVPTTVWIEFGVKTTVGPAPGMAGANVTPTCVGLKAPEGKSLRVTETT